MNLTEKKTGILVHGGPPLAVPGCYIAIPIENLQAGQGASVIQNVFQLEYYTAKGLYVVFRWPKNDMYKEIVLSSLKKEGISISFRIYLEEV